MNTTISLLGFEFTGAVLVLGVIIGMTYGILAVGLVLVFRSNKIINFAHGEIGAFGAALLSVAVLRWHFPYWVAFVLAMAVSAAVAGLAEVAVVRRLRKAPRLMSIVATLGVGQFLLFASALINSQGRAGFLYPVPSPFLPAVDVGALRITEAHWGMLVLTPILVIGLAVFLRRSKYGLAIRGSAANSEAAQLAGIYATRMSTLAWALAGAISAQTAILVSPTKGIISGESFGPGLLLRALVAAVIARMHSLPVALAAGIGVGVTEQLLLWNNPRGGLVEAALFVGIVVTLLIQKGVASSRQDEKGSWAAVGSWAPLPDRLREVWLVRNLGRVLAGFLLAIALLLPTVMSSTNTVTLTSIVAFSIIGVSVGIITGLGGQLTLGQFAIAAVGATASAIVNAETGSFPLALAAAAVGGGLASILIGLPALRIKGLMLSVSTLSFALAVQGWALQQPWMLGEGRQPGKPSLGGLTIGGTKSYYVFSLAVLAAAMWFAHNIRRGGIGRALVATRDNEDNVRAFTLNPTRIKLVGFALSGAVAGVGGSVIGHASATISSTSFPVAASIDVVALTVIGGIGVLAGPLIGALYIIGVPSFLPLDAATLAATSAGWLVLILYAPGGIAQVAKPIRDRLVDWLAVRGGVDAAEARRLAGDPQADTVMERAAFATRREPSSLGVAHGEVLLTARGLRKSFGGVTAVDGLDLQVRRGEILGLIGPNGAGKTTTFELLAGFTKLDAGSIHYDGQDITSWSVEARGRRGLIRSFQDAALFPTMTVLDVVRLSQERVHPTRIGASLLGLQGGERRRDELARELVAAVGLDHFRNKQVQELSTGTRRITELACLVALQPDLLLLDEPSSGIAQRETEALGELLRDLTKGLDLTLLIIEHDIPLIMGLSDRIVAMDMGRVIAEGEPSAVRDDPQVVDAYLGGNLDAIHRSGATSDPGGPAEPSTLQALLDDLPGVGEARRGALLERFADANALRRASASELQSVPGIGPSTATRIREAVAATDEHTNV